MTIEHQAAERVASPPENKLIDQHGRTFDYLRISVTERCNLRCVYCMPEAGVDFAHGEALLPSDEIVRVVRVAAGLGVTKIRITGGEPLVRKDILTIISGAAGTPGIHNIHLTTNGLLLPPLAKELNRAGLGGVNISLDTLNPKKFEKITRRTGLESVLESIRFSLRCGFDSVKVNVVVMRGENDDEIGDFVELTREWPVTVRFIELMPFDTHQVWRTGRFFSAEWIVARLEALFPDMTDADGSRTEQHVFRRPTHAGRIAVIPAFSRTLCGECNRIRLTADGRIRNCLYAEKEFDLRSILREGGSETEIADSFRTAMWNKHRDGWEAQKAGRNATNGPHRESMTQIGG